MNYYKSAIFLSSLPDEQCVQILRTFNEDEVEKICQEMLRLNDVSEEEKNAVIQEFHESMKNSGGTFKVGADYVQDILARAYGVRRSEAIIHHIKEQSEFQVSLDDLVQDVGADRVAKELEQEHPNVVMTILSSLSQQHASDVVVRLTDEMRVGVFKAFAVAKPLPVDLANKIQQGFIQRMLVNKESGASFRSDGIQGVAEILSALSGEQSQKILDGLRQKDQDLASSVEAAIFSFDDLVKLDDRDIQKIISKIEQADLKLALRGAPANTKEKIFKNMSERAAKMLQEDIELMAPQKKELVLGAQQKIIKAIRKMEASNEITIPHGADAKKAPESALI